MTDLVTVSLITAASSIVAAVMAWLTRIQGKEIIEKTGEIHELTNSNLTMVKEELEVALLKIVALQQTVDELRSKEK